MKRRSGIYGQAITFSSAAPAVFPCYFRKQSRELWNSFSFARPGIVRKRRGELDLELSLRVRWSGVMVISGFRSGVAGWRNVCFAPAIGPKAVEHVPLRAKSGRSGLMEYYYIRDDSTLPS